MNLRFIQDVNGIRAQRWHGPDNQWTALEWAGAMCGEAGEAANVAKKIKRLDGGMKQARMSHSREELVAKLGEELADTVLYALCLANDQGIDLTEAIRAKFNSVSEENDFPERL